jgi:hypothetical protein
MMSDWIINFDRWAFDNGEQIIARPVEYGQKITMPCSIKDFTKESYGKYPKDIVSSQLIMEYS